MGTARLVTVRRKCDDDDSGLFPGDQIFPAAPAGIIDHLPPNRHWFAFTTWQPLERAAHASARCDAQTRAEGDVHAAGTAATARHSATDRESRSATSEEPAQSENGEASVEAHRPRAV